MAAITEQKAPPVEKSRPGAPETKQAGKGTMQKKTAAEPNEPKKDGSVNQKDKKSGAGTVFAAVGVAVLILLIIFVAVFYFIMHSNFLGLGEKYRKQLKDIKIVRWVLPQKPDPEDPKYLGQDELINKYNELRQARDLFSKNLSDSNKLVQDLQQQVAELQNSQGTIGAESEKVKLDAANKLSQAEALMKKLEQERALFDEKIKNSADPKTFKDFYEKMNKDTAQRLYSEIIKEQAADAETKKLVTLYETMDAEKVAAIFKEMGTSKMDLMINILKRMKNDKAAEILGTLDASLAGKITDKLFKDNPTMSN